MGIKKEEKQLFDMITFFSSYTKFPIKSYKGNEVISIITLSINEINPKIDKNSINSINEFICMYNNYRDCNDFSNLICPLCHNHSLSFYKTYERNLTYFENSIITNNKIDIIVCKCQYCAKHHNKQKYHALLPEFISPYHIYEISIIIKAINDYLNHKKFKDIIERLQITHKLFYDWLKKILKYTLPSSIVLKINNDLNVVITEMINQSSSFLMQFYDIYHHPFFLFRLTCVPLCITPYRVFE